MQCWVWISLSGDIDAKLRILRHIPTSEMCFWGHLVKYITLIHHFVSQCFGMGPSGTVLHLLLLYSSIDVASGAEITIVVKVGLTGPASSPWVWTHSIGKQDEGVQDSWWLWNSKRPAQVTEQSNISAMFLQLCWCLLWTSLLIMNEKFTCIHHCCK
jgi:hypothetical protein